MSTQEEALRQQRLSKLARLRERGIDPYPPRFGPVQQAAEVIAGFEAAEASGAEEGASARVAGRITAMRLMGKAAFLDLRDGSGRIQVHVRRDVAGEGQFALLDDLDLGDFLGVSGLLFRTRTGEVTVRAETLTVLAKALRPPPEKWHGLQDVEIRYRRRYLDLLANPEVRQIFRVRSGITASIRRFMDGRGFIEVETPVLQPSAGGAAARPFVTHHNALDRDLHLRIATELHLKRLIVGGYDRVYEIGRVFRNEGIDTRHNPEFTMLESYEAYADYDDVARMLEVMVATAAREVLGNTRLRFKESEIDVQPPWPRTTYREALVKYAGFNPDEYPEIGPLHERMRAMGLEPDPVAGWGKLVDEIFATHVEPHLTGPIFVFDYPLGLSPLAKRKADQPGYVERFEAFIGGFEVGNAYTELNDPIDQRVRFEEQLRLRAAGDEEAELVDEDFLRALEHGMPPTGGLGVGIDRLAMVFTDQQSIREVILFPTLRGRDDES